jgi:uncharacterized protein
MARNGLCPAQEASNNSHNPSQARPKLGLHPMGKSVSAVLGSTEVQRKDIFAQADKTYKTPTLVMFFGATRSACGLAKSAMGPFYCPNDQKVYLDTAFFQDL